MSGGIPLINPNVSIEEAEKRDYERRKKEFLKEVDTLGFKYSLAFGAELRATPVSMYAQLVVIDLKRVRKAPKEKN